jgi:Tfp pilus assembly protein FimT
MTLRKKLIVLAVPAVLAAIAIPAAVAHAHALKPTQAAAAHSTQVGIAASSAAHAKAITPAHAVKPAAAGAAGTAKAASAAEATETDSSVDPAETGTDTGHTDEAPGSTGESTTDHQFDGQE